jgi:hypothetical protein
MNKHTPKQHLATYDSDFYLWSEGQAALIRAGKFDQLDIENVAEEIESLGRSDKRALGSQLRRLLMRLLKWEHQASRRSQSWRNSINSARDELRVIVQDSPSLKTVLEASLLSEYRTARKRAAEETKQSGKNFPADCPYSFVQILEEDFWPDM